MELPEPPEPHHLRIAAQEILRGNPAAAQASPHSGADPLAFIYGNRLPRYLWDDGRWGERLTTHGVALEALLKVAGSRRRHFLRWIQGEVSWQEYLTSLEKGLQR